MNNQIKVRAGKGEYFINSSEVVVVVDGQEMSLGDMVKELQRIKKENHIIKQSIKSASEAQEKVDTLFADSIDLLSKKVTRLEIKNSKGDNK